MDSQEAKTENFELPRPTGDAPVESGIGSPEQGAATETQTSPSSSADPAGAATSPVPADPAILGATGPTGSASAHTPALGAEDADLIEKTWVEKAKQIVLETRGDPYRQNSEINKVKADYIKKRYNKDIKLASE